MRGSRLAKRYLLGELLGEGGMGVVYRATDLRTGGPVAVKLLPPALAHSAVWRQRLQREAHLAAGLTSPRVVRVLDLFEHQGTPVLVMEYVAGETLAQLLLRHGRLPVAAALDLAHEIAQALAAAHAQGVIHRDLKPANVKLVEGQVKVLDFGLARLVAGDGPSASGGYLGTPEYSAPEQAEGRADERTDVYALGIVLYELLRGQPPFQGPTPIAVLRQHVEVPMPPLPPEVPADVQAVVRRCLAKEPAARYQSAAELDEALMDVRRRLEARRFGTPRVAEATLELPPPASAIVGHDLGLATSALDKPSRLLERSSLVAALDEALAMVSRTATGRLVFIGGEAGAGKTALVRHVCAEQTSAARVVSGSCDALFTPRPLGPILDIARVLGGDFDEVAHRGGRPYEIVAALMRALPTSRPSIVILEDLHWADDATLDVLRLIARRIETVPALVLATYRDDELDRAHPLRILLGEIATSPALIRLRVGPLSPSAVAELAEPFGVDPLELHRKTAGNAFFVTEALLAADVVIPPTVRDAVLARAARLSRAAVNLLETVAVIPPQVETWALEALAADVIESLDECLSSGTLTSTSAGVAFRHELARLAIEESLTPVRRLQLHRRALQVLAAPPVGAPDLARLAHHAEAAGDVEAVLRFVPAAAAQAAAMGAHREAAAQYARALRYAHGLPPAERGELLLRHSHEAYLTDRMDLSIAAAQAAVEVFRALGDRGRESAAFGALSLATLCLGETGRAEEAARKSIAVLEDGAAPTASAMAHELTMAYALMASVRMNLEDAEGTHEFGKRAVTLAEQFNDVEALVHVLNSIGTLELLGGLSEGRLKLEQSIGLARAAGLQDDVGRGYANMFWAISRTRSHGEVEQLLQAAFDYCAERGLVLWERWLIAWSARFALDKGDYATAAQRATEVLRDPRLQGSRLVRGPALTILGLARVRRGDPEYGVPLDEARTRAEHTPWLQYTAPVAAARAEAAWLSGRSDAVALETEATLEEARRRRVAWVVGELACWRWRAGVSGPEAEGAAEPYALEMSGKWMEAAQFWTERRCPYEAALALASSNQPDALRRALEALQRLGARPAARIVARRLRELGVGEVARRARPSTRSRAAHLTERQIEILELVAQGLRNAEIAERLSLSMRTVDHHVSAILDKLDAHSHGEAGELARRLAEALGLGDGERGALLAAARPRGAPGGAASGRTTIPGGRSAAPELPVARTSFVGREWLVSGARGRAPLVPVGVGLLDEGPLIGREAELGRILPALDVVAAGRGRLVLLIGEPGIGKTRLAREALAQARAVGFGTAAGRCFEQHAGLPFFPFAELLTEAWETAPDPLRAQAPERWAELGRIIPELVPEPPRPGGEDAQQRIRQAVTGFLRAHAAEQPLVLFLDDLHWADSASLDLLLYLGRHLHDARILLLGSSRDVDFASHHPLKDTLGGLVRERMLDEITLHRLPAPATAALIRARLDGEVTSADFLQLVHARTEGNPFFIEEVLKALVEDRTLVQVDGCWQAGAFEEIRVPRSVRLVVAERVGRLAPGAQELLRLASVLGEAFDLDVLLRASEQPESEVLDHLDAALGAKLLVERRGGHVERYGFAHALTRQSLYEELPAHRRRLLHGRVGVALEQLRLGRAEAWGELARHFVGWADPERAVRYAVQAGDHAAGLYAHAEAARYYQLALEFVPESGDPRQAAQLQQRLADELHELNRRADALASYEAALASYERLGDALGQAQLHREIAWVHQARSEFAAALPHLEAALRLWPADAGDAALARLLLDTARVKLYTRAADDAGRLAQRGLALAERLGAPALLARALIEDAFVKAQTGASRSEVLPVLDRAETLALAADPKLLQRVYWNRGEVQWQAGALTDSLADCRRSIAAAERVGQPGGAAWFSLLMAWMQAQAGDWAGARSTVQRAHALDPHIALCPELIPWLDGQHDRALRLLRQSIEETRARADLHTVADSLTSLADALLQLDRVAEAEAPAREALDLVRASGAWGNLVGDAYAQAAEILVRLGSADAEVCLEDAEQRGQRYDHGLSRPALLRTRALLALRRGDRTEARAALQASATEARAQGSLIQLGRTLAALAGTARTIGDLGLWQDVQAERAALVERIGPEVQRLPWAAGVGTRAAGISGRRDAASTGPLAILTRREQEVAALVAQGLTDRQIADALVITEGTVGVHLGHILTKLGCRSRAQVAAWATEHDLVRRRPE